MCNLFLGHIEQRSASLTKSAMLLLTLGTLQWCHDSNIRTSGPVINTEATMELLFLETQVVSICSLLLCKFKASIHFSFFR